jgi:hypothetical protein
LKSVQTHAELGIPTLHYERGKADSAADLSPQMFSSLPQDVSSVIRLYFHNVKAPHAETLRDALRLRDNPSIAEWRKQVFRWTQELEADRINLIEIKRQIEEANGYIEGATLLTKALSIFKPWMTVPAGVAAALSTGLHELHLFGVAVEATRY